MTTTVKFYKLQKEKVRQQKRIDNAVDRASEEGLSTKDAAYHATKTKPSQTLSYEDKKAANKRLMRAAKANRVQIQADYEALSYEIDVPESAASNYVAQQLMQLDLRSILGVNGEEMPCLIFKGNKAWVDVDSLTGNWRYFTKTEDGTVYGLNIYDIFEVVEGLSFGDAFAKLTNQLQIQYKGGDWVNLQRDMYVHNNTVLHKAEKTIKKDYPNLYKLLKSRLGTLVQLTAYATSQCYTPDYSINGNHVFFGSTSFLAKMEEMSGLSKASKSAVARSLRLFATLGLIKRHKIEDVPEALAQKGRNVANNKETGQLDISFFSLKMLDKEVLTAAEEMAINLKNAGITPSTLSYELLVDHFGQNFADEIYPQPPAPSHVISAHNAKLAEQRAMCVPDDLPF